MSAPTVPGAAVRVKFPPALYAATLALSLAVHQWVLAVPIGGRPATTLLGVVLTAAGLAFSLSAVVTVLRHHTTVVPHHAVSRLVRSGPFRISRNPMYLGLGVAFAGAAFWAGTWLPLLVLPLVLAAVQAWVIRPEETYLSERFPLEFAEYRSRVRRWL